MNNQKTYENYLTEEIDYCLDEINKCDNKIEWYTNKKKYLEGIMAGIQKANHIYNAKVKEVEE